MFLVLFRNRKCAMMDQSAYEADVAAMLEIAQQQPGFLSFKSFTAEDGEVLALSEWESAQAAHDWGRHAEHAIVQKRGRELYYESYDLITCDSPRIYSYKRL